MVGLPCWPNLTLTIDNNNADILTDSCKRFVLICDIERGRMETRKHHLCMCVSQTEGVIEMKICCVILYNDIMNTRILWQDNRKCFHI